MSTRAVMGFRFEGQEYKTYNHSDGYPSWLGVRVLGFLRDHLIEVGGVLQLTPEVIGCVATLERIDQILEPTAEQIAKLHSKGILEPRAVSTGKDFYAWLRDCQGDLKATIMSGFWADYVGGWDDEEWGYCIDVDDRSLLVHDGETVIKFAFSEIPSLSDEDFCTQCGD